MEGLIDVDIRRCRSEDFSYNRERVRPRDADGPNAPFTGRSDYGRDGVAVSAG